MDKPPTPTNEPTKVEALASPERAEPIRIIIPSNTEYVRVVRLAVMGVASRMSFSIEDIEDIKLAVSEACNNAILHAGGSAADSGSKSPVEVSIFPFADRVEIEVADGGSSPAPSLRPGTAHAVETSTDDLLESGLGLFLMQTLMDGVEHRTSAAMQTVVRMVKFVPAAHLTPEESPTASGSYGRSPRAGSSAHA